MNANLHTANVLVPGDLERVIEPLANYICATEEPHTALKSALAVLLREIDATNRAASAHFRQSLAV
jgi:hypothetical protein